jgi:hypothetical protein
MDADVLAAHIAHLKELRIQEATLGAHTPPHVKTEIARIEKIVSEAHQSIDFGGNISNKLSLSAYRDVSKVFKKLTSMMREMELYTDTCAMWLRRFDEDPDYDLDFSIIADHFTKERTRFSIYCQDNELFIPNSISV